MKSPQGPPVMARSSSSEPWGGRSPRDLTKAAEMFRFREPPANASGMSDCKVAKDQLEMFPEGTHYGTSIRAFDPHRSET